MAAHSPTDITIIQPVLPDQPQTAWAPWLREIAARVNEIGSKTTELAAAPPGSGPAGPPGPTGPAGPAGATGATGPAGSANMSGMVAGQIPLAATATTVTSSTASLAASFMPAHTGDVTSPAGSTVNTLATVNSNIGTFQGLTVNAKGLVTAAANQNYAPLASPSFTGTAAFAGDVGMGATLTTGSGVSTGAAAIEVGGARTGNGDATLDIHATSSTDYELRLARLSGANGNAVLQNAGTGSFQLINAAGVRVQGTNTNDSAAAGYVGEYIESNIPSGSGTVATTATVLNVTSVSLTAGDWDVTGSILTIPTAGCVISDLRGAISTVSGGLPDASRYAAWGGSITNPTLGLTVPPQRISLAATTTVYLTSYQAFTTAALRICGTISARRAR